MSCNSVSSCENYNVILECKSNIYQGGDYKIPVTVLDKLGNPLDLNILTSIYLILYSEDDIIISSYHWPDLTGELGIDILQLTESDDNIINIGKFNINITGDQTSKFVTGNLKGEMKITVQDESFPNNLRTIIIPCINFGTVKHSKVNYPEQYTPNVTVIKGNVDSVFGRSGNILKAFGDYDASDISFSHDNNNTNVSDYLNLLNSKIENIEINGSGPGLTGTINDPHSDVTDYISEWDDNTSSIYAGFYLDNELIITKYFNNSISFGQITIGSTLEDVWPNRFNLQYS